MLKRGAQGRDVKELQEALIDLGYEMPRWGADGDLGDETLGAMTQFFSDHGRYFDEDKNTVSNAEIASVFKLRDRLRLVASPQNLFDQRRGADRRKIMHHRAWEQVTGVTLHQTACHLGEAPDRWKSLGAHLGITREGKILWMHDFDNAVVHGNGLNSHTVGIEMDGYYAGVEGDLKTFWRPTDAPKRKPMVPTPALIEAAHQAVRWIVAIVAAHGGTVTGMRAHRQASKTRQSDPGSALWKAVALPLMEELKLSDGGPFECIGSGKPIPEAWDPRHIGVKY
jgi:hypothetical protein